MSTLTIVKKKKEVHIAFFSANLPKQGIRVPRLNYIGASLRAYAETNNLVKENYNFAHLWDCRPGAEEVLDKLNNPFLFAFSCYVFNFEWSMHIAKAVKTRYPSCLIVAGGPHVPNIPNDFFKKYPFVDFIVHGEGEITFQNILLEYLKLLPSPANIKGISYHKSQEPITNESGDKLPKIIDTPSAWTSGYLDAAIEEYRERGDPIDVLWETNRGCPFACSFCYWGTLETNKLRQITMERLESEIKYFSEKRVDLIWICDANFGILKRDLEIAQRLADYKVRTGYPRYVSANHTKRTNETLLNIIQLQRSVDQMYGGVWMARQSMDENVLTAIKRPFSKRMAEEAKEWKAKFEAEGSPIKVDLILGLPEETKTSWFKGLTMLFTDGFHEGIFIHYLSLLPNTPLSKQVEEHQLKTVSKPFRLMVKHSEVSEIVVGTKAMPTNDWIECGAMSQLLLGLHIRGTFTRYLSIYLDKERNFSFEKFYVGLLEYAKANPKTFIGQLLRIFINSHQLFANPNINSSLSDSIGEYLPDGTEQLFHKNPNVFTAMLKIKEDRDVGFAQDQYIQMALLANIDEFYNDVHSMIEGLSSHITDDEFLDALRFQKELMPGISEKMILSKEVKFNYNWSGYFFEKEPLVKQQILINFVDDAIDKVDKIVDSKVVRIGIQLHHGPEEFRRTVLARVGASWFERGNSSIMFAHFSQDRKPISMLRVDRGSA